MRRARDIRRAVQPVDGLDALRRHPVFIDPEHGDFTVADPELRKRGIGADGDLYIPERAGD